MQRVRLKPLHFGIQRLAQSADLALAYTVDAEGSDQVVHTPRADAVDVCLLDDRDWREYAELQTVTDVRPRRGCGYGSCPFGPPKARLLAHHHHDLMALLDA